TIEIIENENIVSHTKAMEKVVQDGFNYLTDKHKHFTNDRVVGLLGAFDVYKDRDTNTPFAPEEMAAAIVGNVAKENGLLVRPIMYKGANSIAFAPPLISTKDQIEDAIEILSKALTTFEQKM